MTIITSEVLAEWRRVCEAATKGPWEQVATGVYADDIQVAYAVFADGDKGKLPNAAFIAIARTALPQALGEIERLEASNNEAAQILLDVNAALVLAEAREAELRKALEDVLDPLDYLRREAEARGNRLSGEAYSISQSVALLQSIARQALSRPLLPDGEAGR